MERKNIDISDTRKILIKAITNDEFLGEIIRFADPSLLEDNYSRLILSWCFEYYEKFEQAPKEMIREIYAKKSAYSLNETDSKMIEEILASISREYVTTNIEYYSEMAEKYFNKLKINKLIEKTQSFMAKGRIDEAVEEIKHFKKIERKIPQGVDLLSNSEIIEEALTDDVDELFRLSGAIGELLGPFNRGDLSAIIASQKKGKSTYMTEIATSAMKMGLKVWYFSLEMTKNQLIRRFYQNWCGCPIAEDMADSDKEIEVEIPFFDRRNNIRVRTEMMKGLDSAKLDHVRERMLKTYRTYLKVFTYPRNTFKVSDLKALLENSQLYEDDIPDLVVVDYADIMSPESSYGELRHRLDQIWGDLASLAVEFNIHILTASQANKQAFSRDVEQSDSAEANNKIAHVAKYFALNQNNTNKKQHVMRIAMMADRHREFITDRQVVVLQNPSIGKGIIDSRWAEQIPNLEVEEKKKDEFGRTN